eukprot:TRINITY_DN56387_c0_g1_i1.p1 TRINITY_DN56387_c0_g1~~TRINITY_DN56387_c0_g1_i1.p1  ORF type:complete len:373 (-),score=78.28 TRINITY_DN56387_c0_g1_i1:95-1213(-)
MRGIVERLARHRGACTALMMVTYSAQSLVITASQKNGGAFAYDAGAAVVLAELLKLLFTLACLRPAVRRSLRLSPAAAVYALPAALYAVQNRMVFDALSLLSPAEYQLLNNMKLVTTALVYRAAMGKKLRLIQWLALLLLALGMLLATADPPSASAGAGASAATSARPSTADSAKPCAEAAANGAGGGCLLQGATVMIIISCLSAFAGVSNEWLVKTSTNADHASVWLYLFCTAAAILQLGPSGWGRLLRLEGFSALTWVVIVCNAMLGQTVGFLLRFADSIVKLYALCCTMCLTAVLSVLFFGYSLSMHVIIGYIVVAVSMCLYYVSPQALAMMDADLVSEFCCTRRNPPDLANGSGGNSAVEEDVGKKAQ